MIVYKYVAPSWKEWQADLENSLIRFSQPSALNDPFDMNASDYDLRQVQKQKSWPGFKQDFRALGTGDDAEKMDAIADRIHAIRFDELIPQSIREWRDKEFVILSLSKVRDSLLMWAHYARSHHGYVIGFDADYPFFHEEAGKRKQGLREVGYREQRYKVPLMPVSAQNMQGYREVVEGFFLTKSREWKYEQELRLIAHSAEAKRVRRVRKSFKIWLFQFPPDCVREVIMGRDMSDADKQSVTDIVRRQYAHAELFQAELDDIEFKLRIEKVTNFAD